MLLYLSGHSFQFECENLCRIFFPYSPVTRTDSAEQQQPDGAPYVKAVIIAAKEKYIYDVEIRHLGRHQSASAEADAQTEYQLTQMLFLLLSEFTDYHPQWGMLTGIHPVRLLRDYDKLQGKARAEETFLNEFYVQKEKLLLARRVADVQAPFFECVTARDFCLYVSIPFCPTRCSYCSFVSHSVEKSRALISPYFTLLLDEISKTAEITQNLGLSLISVYVGGGTPTTLSADQLSALCSHIRASFDMSACSEFTVEAGRPDTISAEKLAALKHSGVSRISINPQSLSDSVLTRIGRAHTAADIEAAYALAQSSGISSINADLIAGLPEDCYESFQQTLNRILELGADNITVHCLALKRAAFLTQDTDGLSSHKNAELTGRMVDYSVNRLLASGFLPYYLYRQSRMSGNLENTGWAKPGTLCRYNIYSMDESVSIIACGAGGISKLKDPNSNRLERIFNYKHPHEYISRHEEMIKRKDGVKSLYEQFRQRIY